MDRIPSLRVRIKSIKLHDSTTSPNILGSGDLGTALNPRLPRFTNHPPHFHHHVCFHHNQHESTGIDTQQAPYPFAPERDLTLLALRVAVLEKMASRIGVMAFIWATVVLLGGYVKFLKRDDFWLVSAIILTGVVRVFSRSLQLEWKQAASWSVQLQPNSEKKTGLKDQPESSNSSKTVIAKNKPEKQLSDVSRNSVALESGCARQLRVPAGQDKRRNKSFRLIRPYFANVPRSWSISKTIPFIAHMDLFVGRHMNKILYFLQFMSAFSSIVLSIRSLSSQSYVDLRHESDKEYANLPMALNIFYALALTEASLFLVERSYWEFNIRYKRVLSQVAEDCKVQDLEESLDMITDFFYDVYSKSLNGGIFDGLEMDLVGYSITQIQFDSIKKQFRGIRMLSRFVEPNQVFEADTVRRIGTTPGAIDRLVEMLTWKSQYERYIRLAAASIMDRLVQCSAGSFKIVAVSGALEGIASLLTSDRDYVEENESRTLSQELMLSGLRILRNLTKIHSNCIKIGTIRGLMPTLVSLIQRSKNSDFSGTADRKYQIFLVSFELIRSLAKTGGKSGNALRDQIGRTLYLFQNLRDVLDRNHSTLYSKFRECAAPLSAIKILGSLALDSRRREAIGSTGSMIKNLLVIYQTRENNQSRDDKALRLEAGTALNLLVLQNPNNCKRIMDSNENILETLQDLLENHDPDIESCAANILRTLFAYLDESQRRKMAASSRLVMKMALPDDSANITKHQEAFLGFAGRIISVIADKEMYSHGFDKQIFQSRFVKLVGKLTSNPNLDNFPRIRRHTLELAIALMEKQDESFLRKLQQQDFFKKHLERMRQTMYDLEDFYTFSGLIGLTRHSQTMEDLINKALQKLASANLSLS
ncbi:hypothetical protein O6H91_21G002700 [Diphasiastrum complanatum]|uniref:Uncharacterized protein n=1 Tax=Diphasiastrum complanatum TaxID=34168 RepID=A0ACC2AH51_DIPCM|nr:hypothetical protein O6H91_21G002700 [Diphasiastrum complanatum]